MNKPSEEAWHGRTGNRQSAIILLVVLAFVLGSVFVFLSFYNSYIDQILYAERLSQMREVTTQLFSGLEDVVDNQWRTTSEYVRAIQHEKPETMDELLSFMREQVYLADFENIQCNVVAVDKTGAYCTQNGWQGLLAERNYLASSPERVSYVTNSLITDKTRMVFFQKLDEPITVWDDDKQITFTYCGISQNMDELNPCFECSAYGGNNCVYVVDTSGLKLFSSSNSSRALLSGFNLYTVLEGMEYLHGSSFAATRAELEKNSIAYSNALMNGEEIYYALYRMENAEWSLIFLVPSEYVATNTVELVNMTIRFVMIFAVTMVLLSALAVFWLLRMQQKKELAIERQSNATLEKLNAELQSATRAKSEFLANMSHDIRTPMNAIVGITDLMAHDRDASDKMHTYIEKVRMSSRHLLSLINDVLDMSKIESSEVVLNQDMVSLAEQVGQVDSIIRSQTNERGQTFNIRVHTIAHEYLIGDSVRLRQILLNLLSNAVKYTPNGGTINFDLAEIPCADPDSAALRITVEDTGYGMEPEFMEHIFEPFTRAENSMTNKVQGTGLGMAITKNIVDLMGGTITVQSELNKGSRFEVMLTLPIDHRVKPSLSAKRILLLSDDAVFCHNVSASLQEFKISFITAATVADAEKQLQEKSADLILVNGHLDDPDLAGIVQRLRSSAQNAVLLFCCDYAQSEQVHDMLVKSGADDLIARPFFLSNLSRTVNRVQGHVSESEIRGSGLKGLRFLCAEDNELNAEILQAVLEVNKASCVIYPNGKELVKAFAEVKPGDYDAILMDIQMSVMNGLDATRAIRNSKNPLGRTIPIVAMTANAFTEDIQQCLDAGMDAHVSKPLDIGVLERTMKNVLGGFAGGGTPVRHKRT